VLAIQILMQTVVIVRFVAQQQGCRLVLAGPAWQRATNSAWRGG
jgi:hypothetical protein